MTVSGTAPLTEVLPQWEAAPKTFKHTREGLVNVDQLKVAVGMFDDELRVYVEGSSRVNGMIPNWNIVDYCIDSLLDSGIDPMFTTTFTPSVTASGEMLGFCTKTYRVDNKENNALTDWQAIGAPDYPTREQTKDLHAKNVL